ncbi:MAG: DUF433 domain-containing protein [Pirellulales bacterium]
MTNQTFRLPLLAELPPLRLAEGGVIRVGNSRVSLDLIVEQYENGMAPDEMIRAYDTLQLADVYAAISYYLRHGNDVRAYMAQREHEAEALREKIESERPPISHETLQARYNGSGKDNAPTGK